MVCTTVILCSVLVSKGATTTLELGVVWVSMLSESIAMMQWSYSDGEAFAGLRSFLLLS